MSANPWSSPPSLTVPSGQSFSIAFADYPDSRLEFSYDPETGKALVNFPVVQLPEQTNIGDAQFYKFAGAALAVRNTEGVDLFRVHPRVPSGHTIIVDGAFQAYNGVAGVEMLADGIYNAVTHDKIVDPANPPYSATNPPPILKGTVTISGGGSVTIPGTIPGTATIVATYVNTAGHTVPISVIFDSGSWLLCGDPGESANYIAVL